MLPWHFILISFLTKEVVLTRFQWNYILMFSPQNDHFSTCDVWFTCHFCCPVTKWDSLIQLYTNFHHSIIILHLFPDMWTAIWSHHLYISIYITPYINKCKFFSHVPFFPFATKTPEVEKTSQEAQDKDSRLQTFIIVHLWNCLTFINSPFIWIVVFHTMIWNQRTGLKLFNSNH